MVVVVVVEMMMMIMMMMMTVMMILMLCTGQAWVIKPPSSNQGKGISITADAGDV